MEGELGFVLLGFVGCEKVGVERRGGFGVVEGTLLTCSLVLLLGLCMLVLLCLWLVEVPEVTHRVYLDVTIDGQNAGMGDCLSCCLQLLNVFWAYFYAAFLLLARRIVIGLYGNVVPKTVGMYKSLVV